MLSVAIVDDEPLARARLKRMLGAANIELDVVVEGEDGQQALDIVRSYQLDLLVIDINMPALSGMEVVKKIEREMASPPAIIFCTAYDKFAVEAFKTEAVAYLLKPFSQLELDGALSRVEKKLNTKQIQQTMVSSEREELLMHYGGQLQKVDIRDIVYFYSQAKAVYSVMRNADQVLIDQPLKQLEQQFEESFIRTHRAYLVQTRELKGLLKHEGAFLVSLRSSDHELPVSRRHLKKVKQCFVQHF